MSNNEHTSTTDLLEELYRIDPDIRQYEADLPNLITALTEHRPNVPIDEAFVRNLRSSLLEKASAPTTQPNTLTPLPSPFFWWTTRLAPIGLAIALLITLVPTPTEQLPPYQPPLESVPTTPSETSIPTTPSETSKPMGKMAADPSMSDDSARSMATEATMLTMQAPSTGIVVEPPTVGDTATVTAITLPEAGWLVVYTDDGGAFSEVLGTTLLDAGEHNNLVITLTRRLRYPEMITLIAYTGKNQETFIATDEVIQIDPATNAAMTVTVPVVSELELGLPQ